MSDLESEKLEALAEFAAGAGHEINNPLAVISGRAQLLLRGEDDPQRRQDLAIIHVQAMRIHDMIADLMMFARPPSPDLRPADLGPVVDSALAALSAKSATLEVQLIRAGERAAAPAVVDARQIEVAVRALVDNALNACERGGRVTVELRRASDDAQPPAWEIVVSDDGPGLTEEARRHAFDPFYSGRQAGRGLGMGLPKAWRIATNHGGSLAAEPSDRGARFVLRVRGRETASDAPSGASLPS